MFYTSNIFQLNVTYINYMITAQNVILIISGVALVSIVIASKNIIMIAISSVAMSMVVIGTTAWIGILSWDFGLIELISLLFVTGFPLDVTMRASFSYKNAPYESRNDKIQYVQGELGQTVLTALLASFLFCLPFFFSDLKMTGEFALLMTLTVV
jgi:hypothetical protein